MPDFMKNNRLVIHSSASDIRGKLSIFLALTGMSACAQTAVVDEATATIAACGKPLRDKTTYQAEMHNKDRRLVYKDITLHFFPVNGVWQLRMGAGPGYWYWSSDRQRLAEKLPCLRAVEDLTHQGILTPQ